VAMQQRATAMQEILAARFPDCFRMSGPRLPLMIGIDKEFISAAPDLNADDVRWAIRNYVSSPEYGEAMVEGAGYLPGWCALC
jgi:sRNA-binding protein